MARGSTNIDFKVTIGYDQRRLERVWNAGLIRMKARCAGIRLFHQSKTEIITNT